MKKYLMFAAAALLLGGIGATEAKAGPVSVCKSCHTFEKEGKNKMGPNLFGIIGRPAGHIEDFKYGTYLSTADFTWDEERIRAWIKDSGAVAKAAGKKTKMPAQHITGADADAVIAFLKEQK
jgi:cytochrome c